MNDAGQSNDISYYSDFVLGCTRSIETKKSEAVSPYLADAVSPGAGVDTGASKFLRILR